MSVCFYYEQSNAVCPYVIVWWAGVTGPHTGVCMLTFSLMHQLIGLLRQPDIFTHSNARTHTRNVACNSHTHVWTDCANAHMCVNTTMHVSTFTGSLQSGPPHQLIITVLTEWRMTPEQILLIMYALLLKSTAKENENHRLQHYTVKHTSQDTPHQKEGNCPLTHKRQCKPVAAANFPVIPKIQYDNTEIPNLTVTVFCVVVFVYPSNQNEN